MNTCHIEGRDRTHLKNLLIWLFDEIEWSCGDGDAALLMKRYGLNEMRNLIIDFLDAEGMSDWTCSGIQEGSYFTVGHDQECLLVTTDEKKIPSWSQCTVKV